MSDEKKDEGKAEEIMLVNARDEEQILAELSGVPVDEFVYKNKRGQYELTYAGTKWAVRKLAERGEAIREVADPQVAVCPMDPEYITVTIRAARYKVSTDPKGEVMLDTSVGAARNWKSQRLTSGKVIPDENFFKKAIGIATRNAKQSLLPQDFLRDMIDALARKAEGKPDPKPKAEKPAKSEAKKPEAEKPKEEAKKPEAEAPKGPATETTRQKLYRAMHRFAGTHAEKKKLLKELTGKESSKECEEVVVTRLTAAFERAGDGKVNEVKRNPDGTHYILEKPTGNIIYGTRAGEPAPAATPAGGSTEEPF